MKQRKIPQRSSILFILSQTFISDCLDSSRWERQIDKYQSLYVRQKENFPKATNLYKDLNIVCLEENKISIHIMVLQNKNDFNTFVLPEKPKGQQVRFFYNELHF